MIQRQHYMHLCYHWFYDFSSSEPPPTSALRTPAHVTSQVLIPGLCSMFDQNMPKSLPFLALHSPPPPHKGHYLIAPLQDENDSLSLRELVATRRGVVTVAMEATALLGMSPFLYIEACTVIEYGPRRWLSIWNLMDLATYFLQVHVCGLSHTCLHICDVVHAWSHVCAVPCVHVNMHTCMDLAT